MRNRVLWTMTVCFIIILPMMAGEKDKGKPAKPTTPPTDRIEQLLQTLKTDRKEEHRSKAAEELGKLASPDYPEVVSGLIDALVRDESSSVRKVLVRTLADIEPATHEVKDVLDQTVKQDKSWTVRQAARLILWRYKPTDEPPSIPGPKIRNTSKPSKSGTVPATKITPEKAPPPVDPLKSMPIPSAPVPVVPVAPAPPAPMMAPAPGLPGFGDPIPKTASGVPAQLTAPKPGGN